MLKHMLDEVQQNGECMTMNYWGKLQKLLVLPSIDHGKLELLHTGPVKHRKPLFN